MNKGLILFALSLLAGPTVFAADLKMRIVWDGDIPKPRKVENSFLSDCRNVDLNADQQFIDAETRGVRDAVVYVAPPRKDRERWRQPPRKETVRIEVRDCRIHPHISIAQSGDLLTVSEQEESAAHNLNFSFLMNSPHGTIISQNATWTRELTSPEPAPIPIDCDVHSWERGYLFVLDHTYIAVSDRQGSLVIRGLPDDTDVPLRLFHEHGGIHSIVLQGERRQIDRGRINVRVSKGTIDLGDVVIDTQSFTRPEPEKQ